MNRKNDSIFREALLRSAQRRSGYEGMPVQKNRLRSPHADDELKMRSVMYYLESKEPGVVGGKAPAWRPVCYCIPREPLDETVVALGSENYRVMLGAERRKA